MYENDIKQWALSNIGNCSFDLFVTYCKDRYYGQNMLSNNVSSNDKLSTKILGDLFETFCKMYLKNIMKFQDVWFLNELPGDLKTKLNLGRDYGIDLIAFDGSDYHAVQCKYRTRNKYKQKTGVPWKELSTFYAIVTKTGPYKSHIVMTNVDYVRHIGEKSNKDKSICYGTFKNLIGQQWLDLLDVKGHTLGNGDAPITNGIVQDIEDGKDGKDIKDNKDNKDNGDNKEKNEVIDIRAKRLAYFQRSVQND